LFKKFWKNFWGKIGGKSPHYKMVSGNND